jgi:23S rRNA pseudouridine1911/1915/1917 synthase
VSPKNPIPILYEDDTYVVFDKPARLLVIPTPKGESNTLVNIVNDQYVAHSNGSKLHVCHRLDRDTSGAIIFAKGKRAQQAMMDLFKQGSVTKKYIAFVHGKLEERQGEFKGKVLDADEKKFRKLARGKTAMTHYRVTETKKDFSVVEVEPMTGRTNQIRIHFSKNGHPLVGERKYAFPRDYTLKFRRPALHAFSLEWQDPKTGKKVNVQSPLAKDMEEFSGRNRN